MLRNCYIEPVQEDEWPQEGDCGPASIAKACDHVYGVKMTAKEVRSATVSLLRREDELDEREQHVLNLLTGVHHYPEVEEATYQDSGDGTKLGWLREAAYKAALPNDPRSFFMLSDADKEQFYARLMLDETEAEEAYDMEGAYYMNVHVLIMTFEVIICPPNRFPRTPGRPVQIGVFLDPQSRLHESLNDNRFPLAGLNQYNDQAPGQHPHRGPRAYIVHSVVHMVPLLIDHPDPDPPHSQPPPPPTTVVSPFSYYCGKSLLIPIFITPIFMTPFPFCLTHMYVSIPSFSFSHF
jgi:hypothetical protein